MRNMKRKERRKKAKKNKKEEQKEKKKVERKRTEEFFKMFAYLKAPPTQEMTACVKNTPSYMSIIPQ